MTMRNLLFVLAVLSLIIKPMCVGAKNVESGTIGNETITVNGVSFKMIAIEGGSFMMGSSEDDKEAYPEEKPLHEVRLSSFAMGETEVTQALWEAVMGSNPSNHIGSDFPVEQITRDDCEIFLKKLNALTGKTFRLPTEAEWEYAARGGNKSKGYKYAGSNDIDLVAWYDGNSDGVTHPVAQKQANELRLYDMSGNVWEFCQDYYDDNYYNNSPTNNPCNTTESYAFTMRGGGPRNISRFCRVAFRADQVLLVDQNPVPSNWDMGIRLVMSYETNNSGEPIDLGLPSGTKWASCNVGATRPEEFGGYYAWGETEEKNEYYESNYIHSDGSQETCHNLGSSICGTQYDVATVKWGDSWQMPTSEQVNELFENCVMEWTSINGTKGVTLTGPNGSSIFLPAAGERFEDESDGQNEYGDYFSGTQHPSLNWAAYGFYFGYNGWGYEKRWNGHSVRPVYKQQNTCDLSDIPTTSAYYAATSFLCERTVLSGSKPDGKTNVNDPLLRSHLAKIAFRGVYLLNGRQVPEKAVSDDFPTVYEDIAVKTNYNDYYYQAARALLYLEYGDGRTPFDRNRLKFEPEATITRINVLKVLMETFNIQPDMEGMDNPFPNDKNVEEMASNNPLRMGYIRKAAALGIITTGNEQFRPYDECLRGEAFNMLARIMRKIEAGEIEDPNPQESAYFQPLNTTLATVGLGVGLQMGNFQHYTKTSFALSGTIPLAFAHTYNSYNTTLPSVFFGAKTVNNVEETYQPLGDGWSHNYHSFITVVSEKTEGSEEKVMKLIVHWGGGSINVYKSKDGKFVPESMGIYDELSVSGNEVVVKSKSQMEYHFSKQGSTGANVLYLYSVKDRNGNTLTVNYQDGQNGSKRISNVSDGQRNLYFSYLSGTDLLEKVTDPLNRAITFTYFDNKQTGKKQLESFTDAEGNKTTYEYADLSKAGTSKLLKRIQLPKGNYIENEYDANMRLNKTVSGANGIPTTQTNVTVNAKYGNTISTESQVDVVRGSQTSSYKYSFNENNVVTGITGAEGMYVNSTYGSSNHPELPTYIENNSTSVSNITYDNRGNVTSITVKGDGTLTTKMTYDDMNNLTSVTDPMNNKTTYTYDNKGNLKEVSAPEGIKASITVDEKGLPTEVKNAMGIITNYEYNKYGNVEKVSLPAMGLESLAEYDAASRLTKATDALRRTMSFVYDNNDNLTSETDPMKHTTKYEYDANGNMIRITNAKGGVTSLSYDNATDWLVSVAFNGATKNYSYNKDGSLNTYTKPDGTSLNYSYDELGRMTNDGVNDYSYDSKLRLSSVSGNGKKLSFTYDGFNRITNTKCDNYSNSYTYDDNGNCTSINNTTYSYDGLNRLTSVKFSGNTIKYTYRKDSQLDKVEYPNGMTTEYSYDAIGRLTNKTTKLSNGTVVAGYSYTLDKVGNITEQSTQEPYGEMALRNESTSYTYNDGNHITKAGDISFSFDENGNTTKRGSESYSWDEKDRLTMAGSTSLTYDPLGLIASYGDITFTTDPLGIGNVLSDSKSGAEYIYGNGLEARVKGGKVSYYVTDVRGSVVAIVDENGNITHKYQYDDFGNVTQKQEADYNPFQYVGKYGVMYLSDHQYYMRARHYDPTIGRFLSEDPIWSTNLYPYADNNPINGIDPEGLEMQYITSYADSPYHNEQAKAAYQNFYYGFIDEKQYKKKMKEIDNSYNNMKNYPKYDDKVYEIDNSKKKIDPSLALLPQKELKNSAGVVSETKKKQEWDQWSGISTSEDFDQSLIYYSGNEGDFVKKYAKGSVWVKQKVLAPTITVSLKATNAMGKVPDKIAGKIYNSIVN